MGKASIFGLEMKDKLYHGSERYREYWLMGCVILFMAVYFSWYWMHPSQYAFSSCGDGTKNLYTAAYYVANDTHGHFTGMNYPYGESVVFTDNQPIVSYLLSAINRIMPLGQHYFLLFHSLLILGIILCVLFSYRIFRFFQIESHYAVWGALIYTMISPQLSRIDAHQSLGYLFIIPLFIYVLLRLLNNTNRLRYIHLLGMITLISTFLHPYYWLITNIGFYSIYLIYLVVYRIYLGHRLTKWWKPIVIFSLWSIISALLLKGTDSVPDRPSNPFGIDTYVSSHQALLFPNKGWVFEALGRHALEGEGEAYIGMAALLLIPLFLIASFLYMRKSKSHFYRSLLPEKHQLILISVFLGGILSMGFASGWWNKLGLSHLYEIVPSLKNFRSLGRLAWMSQALFFYSCFCVLARLAQIRHPSYWRFPAYILLLWWTIEGVTYYYENLKDIRQPNLLYDNDQFKPVVDALEAKGYEMDDFQSLLSLPLVMVGSEPLHTDRGLTSICRAFAFSYIYSLPMMDFMMSRTSISQAMNLLEMFTPSYTSKNRLKEMDNRPLLAQVNADEINQYEAHFLKTFGEWQTHHDGQDWYIIRPQHLYHQDSVSHHLQNALPKKPLYHLDFNQEDGPAYAGTNGKQLNDGEYVIWHDHLDSVAVYECSFWLYFDENRSLPSVLFSRWNSEGNKYDEYEFGFANSVLAHDQWLRVSWLVETFPGLQVAEVKIIGQQCIIDEFVVKLHDEECTYSSGDDIMINNYRVSP